MIRVYLSSPYSIGNKLKNINRHIKAANDLMDAGFDVYCPLLNHYLDKKKQRTWDFWLAQDIRWMKVCDVMLRLDGESKGADKEEEEAKRIQMQVFYSVEEIIRFVPLMKRKWTYNGVLIEKAKMTVEKVMGENTITSSRRFRKCVAARWYMFTLLDRYTRLTPQAISNYFRKQDCKGFDRTNMMHCKKQLPKDLEANYKGCKAEWEKIRQRFVVEMKGRIFEKEYLKSL